MNKIVTITLTIAGFASLLVVTVPAFAPVLCCYYEDTPPDLLRVGPNYGFITHQPLEGPVDPFDFSFDSRSSLRWDQAVTSQNYQINVTGLNPNSPFNQGTARQKIQDAENNWYNTMISSNPLVNFIYQSDGNNPSAFKTECNLTGEQYNGINEIGFCPNENLGEVRWSGAQFEPSTNTFNEADMLFDSALIWPSETYFYNVALHEFGHWYGLGDIYRKYDCAQYELPNPPVMCDSQVGALQWGDKDGIRWLYPKTYSFGLSAVNIITGADAAVAEIACSGPDLLAVWGDYSGGGGQTTIKSRFLWDLDSVTGARATTGTIQTLVTVSGQTYDVGATLYKVDADQMYDLIITYAVPFSGNSITYYMIFWDITRSGNCGSSFTYSGTAGPYAVPWSVGDRGTDVAVFDIDGDITRDLVVTDSYLLGSSYTFWYYYGPLSGAGTVSTWHTGISSGEFSLSTEDIGFSRPYSFVNAVSFKDTFGWPRQSLFHFANDESIDYSIENKYAPLKKHVSITGFGAGDAINLGGEQSTNEMFFVWTTTSTGYYIIEWDSELNSHD